MEIRERFLKLKEGDTMMIKDEKYMRIGMFLMNLKDDNDLLLCGIDF
jgi:hypothetical protein